MRQRFHSLLVVRLIANVRRVAVGRAGWALPRRIGMKGRSFGCGGDMGAATHAHAAADRAAGAFPKKSSSAPLLRWYK